jgi:hypothetical protein
MPVQPSMTNRRSQAGEGRTLCVSSWLPADSGQVCGSYWARTVQLATRSICMQTGELSAPGSPSDDSDRVPLLVAKLSGSGLADFTLPLDLAGADAPVHFYLAPEAQRTRTFSPSADIYSLGVCHHVSMPG